MIQMKFTYAQASRLEDVLRSTLHNLSDDIGHCREIGVSQESIDFLNEHYKNITELYNLICEAQK